MSSAATKYQRQMDEQELEINRPVPNFVPGERGCAESGWKGHRFDMVGVDDGICAYCGRTREQVAAARAKTQAA